MPDSDLPTAVSPLRALCETAARALRASVSLSVAEGARRALAVAFDPATGDVREADDVASAGDGPRLEVEGDGVALGFTRPAGSDAWTESERAMAAGFARLAVPAARAEAASAAPLFDEAALRNPESYYRAVFEHCDAMLWVQDPDTGDVLEVNQTACDAAGYSAEEYRRIGVGGCAWGEPPYSPADAMEHMRRVGETGGPHRFEWSARHSDGHQIWVDVTLRHVTLNGVPRLLATCRRVDELRAAREALRDSEEHFRRLIETGSDLLMISAADGSLTYVSPSAERLLGYTPAEMLSLRPEDLLHPDDAVVTSESIGRVVATPGTAIQASWRIRHKDGSWREFDAIGKTLDPRSPAAGIVVNARDITERRAAEEALRQATAEAQRAREEAERANLAKSEFLSRMSHELRTPLNSILGFAQVLEDVELAPEYRAGVRHILNGGRHLLGLINEVLDIARIETDPGALSLEPVRLGAAVRDAVDMVRPLAAARGIRVAEVAGGAADRYVHADRQRLAQVLLNLLSNAVKYNRPEGLVCISCETVDEGGAEWLRVRVEDQGEGIAAEHRGRLFTPFERLGAERSGIEGTGLGLALSQHLARAMGGALVLARTGPQGSEFRVDLRPAEDPLASAGVLAAQAERAAGDTAAAPEVTLLYVEDNLANLSLVETILLPRSGWRVLPALQGRMGVEMAREHAPDVILLDLHLPDLPGREVLRLLRADPRTADTPVVVISADATPRTAETLMAEGADAFLTKPLAVRDFLGTLERLLAGARAGA